MTILELICIFCGAGWAVAIVCLVLVVLVGAAINGKNTSLGVNVICGLLILLVVSGFVGCAAEDRVCEVAERGQ